MRGIIRFFTLFSIGLSFIIGSLAHAELVAGDPQYVTKKRTGRTVYEYTFKLPVTNTGADPVNGVSATVAARDGVSYITIVDGDLAFGDVAAGETVVSSDTFSFRLDRRYRFHPSFVEFQFNGTAPEPPALTLLTDPAVRHLLDRITFGATPEILRTIGDAAGGDAYLVEQLDPASIDDSEFDAMIAGMSVNSPEDLQVYEFLHAIYSKRQLREVMTLFWDNHFNTNLNSHGNVGYELAENQAFRAHALGNFRDLLEVSAKSPAMLIYLDGVSNVKAGPNENYPRELMELHTLGVDGGYTQADVEAVARALTGWGLDAGGEFFFDLANHDTDAKTVLGQDIPAGRGIEDGEQVLDILAAHPSTASFICTKLVTLLVSDSPPASLVTHCATVFRDNINADDQIVRVLQSILTSNEFKDQSNYRTKVKTPFELAAGVARNFQVPSDAHDLPERMGFMAMRLFQDPVPTGFSETGDDWINSNLLLERINFADWASFQTPGGQRTSIDPWALANTYGLEEAQPIVDFFFTLAFGSDYTSTERDAALGVLTDNGDETFTIFDPDADHKLRTLLGTMLSFPGYQYQ